MCHAPIPLDGVKAVCWRTALWSQVHASKCPRSSLLLYMAVGTTSAMLLICCCVGLVIVLSLTLDDQEGLLASTHCWTWPAPPWLLPTQKTNVTPRFWNIADTEVKINDETTEENAAGWTWGVFVSDVIITINELFFKFWQLLLHFIQNILNKKNTYRCYILISMCHWLSHEPLLHQPAHFKSSCLLL